MDMEYKINNKMPWTSMVFVSLDDLGHVDVPCLNTSLLDGIISE